MFERTVAPKLWWAIIWLLALSTGFHLEARFVNNWGYHLFAEMVIWMAAAGAAGGTFLGSLWGDERYLIRSRASAWSLVLLAIASVFASLRFWSPVPSMLGALLLGGWLLTLKLNTGALDAREVA